MEAVESLLAWKAAVVGGWFAILFAAERLAPRDPAAVPAPGAPATGMAARVPPTWRRVGRNGALWALTVGIWPLVVVPLTAWAVGHRPMWRPDWWTGGTGLVLDIVLLDFLIYWWHMANHRVPLLWRFHEVHHLDRKLDTTTALRFHFGEVMLSALARAGMIVLLGFPLASVLVFEAMVLLASIFHHSNLAIAPRLERALSGLIITPSIHWVHHHKLQADTDSNYGTIFSFWDRLFRTKSPTPRSPGMDIGVETEDEEPVSRLVIRPFLSRARA